MKKVLIFMVALVLGLGLVGCGAKAKEFEGVGLKVTLTSDFKEVENIGAQTMLQTASEAFVANRESKDDVRSILDVTTLSDYFNAVVSTKGYDVEATEYRNEDGQVQFIYGYYDATVDGMSYGYMIVVLEGDAFFYTTNFMCFKKNLDKNKDKYLNWAQTIVVE